MRLVVDAMGTRFGGVATYAQHLLNTWPGCYPDDELHVLVPEGDDAFPLPGQGVVRHGCAVFSPSVVGRPWAQTRRLPALVRATGADAVLALIPSTTLRATGRPLAVVVHDLRHEIRPEQFSRARRAIRGVSYAVAYRQAEVIIAVSQRSMDDLLRLRPGLRSTSHRVVHHGADHVDSWARGRAHGRAVAFAHHSNKNVDLLLDAWVRLTRDTAPAAVPRLLLLGLDERRRGLLARELAERGIQRHVDLAPFMPATEFEKLMTGASLIVFPSDFEGFGLPVVEALRLRTPVVIGPEPACLEVAGGHATVMQGWSGTALADAVTRALASSDMTLEAGAAYAQRFTWAATVEGTRAALLDAIGSRRA